jgi:hypothetical protein
MAHYMLRSARGNRVEVIRVRSISPSPLPGHRAGPLQPGKVSTMSTSVNILWLESFLKLCSPRGEPFPVREPFQEDEATWFRRAIEQGLFLIRECVPSCPRRKRCRESGPDEFVAAHGRSGLRHLFPYRTP